MTFALKKEEEKRLSLQTLLEWVHKVSAQSGPPDFSIADSLNRMQSKWERSVKGQMLLSRILASDSERWAEKAWLLDESLIDRLI